ncbi:methyltransferase domain-containing protein [Prauserella rugosa]|uniref:Methyltransferase family protein n=1 Tax=Prauserella rugosa TaxID=43354 RepID=A0A660CA40_9PSEU|nr:methyltransferase domain-containing protein [Prauserella rugosa]TWH18603.1 methyltransferase family protein [Prauserella rugosa]
METVLPEAVRRTLPLLTSQPDSPPVRDGYLDLLGGDAPAPSGFFQSLWESRLGTVVYEPVQSGVRKVFAGLRPSARRLRLPEGGTALDVGCGPGNVTADLGRDVGPGGLAVGVDVSRSMLRRAASAYAGPNVGFVRSDASALPLRTDSVDAITCLMVLQLLPDPEGAIAEFARVLVPGGRAAILLPGYAGPGAGVVATVAGVAGVRLPGHEAIAATFERYGMEVLDAGTTAPVARLLAEKPR